MNFSIVIEDTTVRPPGQFQQPVLCNLKNLLPSAISILETYYMFALLQSINFH